MKNNLTEKNIRDFLRYNNAVPLFVAIAAVISGSAFAATTDGQAALNQALVGKTEKVISVDNTYIASVNLNSWTPTARVTAVTEDSDYFYVTYTLSTINIRDYKWQNVDEENILKVEKNFLKEFRSLEDYVKYELSQRIDAEKERLAKTQEIEQKNVTQMAVVTSYSGLVGIVLDERTVVADPFAPAPASLTPGLPPLPAQVSETITEQVTSTTTATTTVEIVNTDILSATSTSTTTLPIVETSTSTAPTEIIPEPTPVENPTTPTTENAATTTETTTPTTENTTPTNEQPTQ